MTLPTPTTQHSNCQEDESPLVLSSFDTPFDNMTSTPESRYWPSPGNSCLDYHDLDRRVGTASTYGEAACYDYSASGMLHPGTVFDGRLTNGTANSTAEELYGSLDSQAVQPQPHAKQSVGYRDKLQLAEDAVVNDGCGSTRGSKRYRDSEEIESASPPTIRTESSASRNSSKTQRDRERNRIAAHKCRKKAKHNVEELQQRERELSQKNNILASHASCLREEILGLKNEILRHSTCDSDIIQNYIAKAAREI